MNNNLRSTTLLNHFILLVIWGGILFLFFTLCAKADVRVQIVRVRGEHMQTDYQFDYAVNETLKILNDVSPVSVRLKRIRTINDPWPGSRLSASGRFSSFYRYAARKGWLHNADATAFVDRPTLQKTTGYPYSQGFAYLCSVFTSKAHSVSMVPDKRYNGDDTKFMGVTALAHEILHQMCATHVWLADGSCNNLMHTGALACSVYSVPPISSITYSQVFNGVQKQLNKRNKQ